MFTSRSSGCTVSTLCFVGDIWWWPLTQAKRQFEGWHGQRWLAPRKLLDRQNSSVTPKLLPFWLFEVSVRVRHSATLGFAAEG